MQADQRKIYGHDYSTQAHDAPNRGAEELIKSLTREIDTMH